MVVLALGGLLAVIAPTRIDGPVTYYSVAGQSMKPQLEPGDLALVRAADRYEVGDVIAYNDPVLGVVLHRIRAVDGARFVTRGVNRDDDDSFRPTSADINGRLWLRVPRGGAFLALMRTPRNALLTMLAVMTIGLIPTGRRALHAGALRRDVRSAISSWAGGSVGSALLGYGALAAILGGGILLFLHENGPTALVKRDALIEHVATWKYGGMSAGSGVYDRDRVATGQPVFLSLTRAVPLVLRYHTGGVGTADSVADVQGDLTVQAVISAPNKWSRVVDLQPQSRFAGANTTTDLTLDVEGLLRMASAVEQQTGVKFGMYHVVVTATINTSARVNDRETRHTLIAPLPFDMTTQQLIPNGDVSERVVDVVKVQHEVTAPWSLAVPVVGQRLSYAQLLVAGWGLVLAGAAAVFAAALGWIVWYRDSVAGRIRTKYRSMLVSAQPAMLETGGQVVAVDSFEDLMKIAVREDACILDIADDSAGRFAVLPRRADLIYLYAAQRAAAGGGEGLGAILDAGVVGASNSAHPVPATLSDVSPIEVVPNWLYPRGHRSRRAAAAGAQLGFRPRETESEESPFPQAQAS